MKRVRSRYGKQAVWLACIVLLCILSCTRSQKDILPAAVFAPYVKAYTGGSVSQDATIRIELAQDQPVVDLANELKENPFRFSPSLKGKTYWVNNHTLEFVPAEGALKPGMFYKATFNLGDFVEVDKELKKFDFSFRVQEPGFSLYTEPVTITSGQPDVITIQGEIRFNKIMKQEEVQEMIGAFKDKTRLAPVTVTPTHHPTRFQFSITNIAKQTEAYELTLRVDGSKYGIKQVVEENMLIPAKKEFCFLSARRIEQPENGIEIAFSDPLSTTQDLKGLIEMPEVSFSVSQIKDNKVYLFFERNQLSKQILQIHQGVRNYLDQPLKASASVSLSEVLLKPQVELSASAAILPDSKNLIIPFRAVGLYAVDLSVVRIFENNILMFMQENTLASSSDLRRSGRLVYQKTLWLGKDASKDIRQWDNYSIDLAGLIQQEPGAIYRIILSFKQEYAAYPCGGEADSEMRFAENETAPAGLTSVTDGMLANDATAAWDEPNSYFYYNGGIEMNWNEYKWEERDNPCHPSYYMVGDRAASCNVLASDIGLIVKQNSLNKLWITVNNILDTEPLSKAKVTVYNFQLQPIGKGETNGEGFVEITPGGVPFIVVAESGKQKGYVRVKEGEELSISRFDTGGKEIQKGLKGFIYGERGVWRPGDTLHLSFILEDRERRIPDKHPVALEVYNSKGQFHTKLISTQGTNGFYTFDVPTPAEAPTGIWNAYAQVGGATFHKSLLIETIKPNRLKINLHIPDKRLQPAAQQTPVQVAAAWLTGATASHLKTKVEMSLQKVHTQFDRYKEYLFNNPAIDFTGIRTEVFTGTLDATGKASFLLGLPEATNAPGMLNATFTTRVFEPGGDASIYTQSIPFSPFTSYVGIRLNQPKGKQIETDTDHVFDIVTLNADGKPVNRNNLEYKIYRIKWSWWWENDKENFSAYVQNSSISPVAGGSLQTRDGKASFSFRVDYPEWGRYLVYVKDKESGHATGGTVFVDWPEWKGRSNKTDPDGIKMLTFSLDKETYETEETATAIIPATAAGRALVSIENGSTVLKREWIKLSDTGDYKYTFKITPEMAPNAYLHVLLLQPHHQTVNDLPIRMYGITPIFVTNRQTLLHPEIRMPDVLRPETAFTVSVGEKNGKAMTYTLAIVDDGLLDLTNFKTPDPWNEFYARGALGIRTWDMYDNVLGAFTGRYGALFSIGGDATLKPAENKANRFKPVVRFIGPFYLPKGKQHTHTMKLPMYVGSVRAMVIAGQEGAYGNAEKTASVRTPLMLLSTLPRVLSTQEEIAVPVNLFAMEKQVKNATVSIQVSGADIQVVGNAQQSVTFAQPGDQLVYFTLKTGKKTGKATIHIAATGGGEQTKETVELEIRNPNPVVTLRDSRWLAAGEEAAFSYTSGGASSADSRVQLEVSRIPAVDMSRRFDFLYNYQHYCTEQLTSKALPLLFVSQLKETDAQENEKIQANIQEGIRRIYSRQLPNGGFVYWPGHAAADEWITSYTGLFLLLAQEKGYAVHANTLDKWKRFQRTAARNWRAPASQDEWMKWQAELQQAFRLYTLALAGIPEHGAMNRMKEQGNLTVQAKWRLAAAYALAGKAQPAGELIFNAQNTVVPYSSVNIAYSSSAQDEAMILETLILMKRQQEALQQAKIVSGNLARETQFSTQSTAFALVAMGQLAEQLSGTLEFEWSWNGKQQPAVKSAKAIFEKTLSTSAQPGTVTVKNRSKGTLNADLITRMQLLNDTLPEIADKIRLDVKYTDINGVPISIQEIKQGSDLTASVTVSNISESAFYTHLALTHIFPSGWEVYNERMLTQDTNPFSAEYVYQDIRDDRILTYFSLPPGKSKTFNVRLQATYAGHFILPAIQCEALYDTAVQARTRAGRIHVTR